MRKIAIVGPESTGKSTLARQLAAHFDAPMVVEYAREYLERLNGPYTQIDLQYIAVGQLRLEKEQARKATDLLICDTNLLVIKIWSEVKYGNISPIIESLMDLNSYHLHLLCKPDIPWQSDPLREHPHMLEALYDRYESALKAAQVPFWVVEGQGSERLACAVEGVRQWVD